MIQVEQYHIGLDDVDRVKQRIGLARNRIMKLEGQINKEKHKLKLLETDFTSLTKQNKR